MTQSAPLLALYLGTEGPPARHSSFWAIFMGKMNGITDEKPFSFQRLEGSPPQFPHLDSRGFCLSPTDVIMKPQLGSPIQCSPLPSIQQLLS